MNIHESYYTAQVSLRRRSLFKDGQKRAICDAAFWRLIIISMQSAQYRQTRRDDGHWQLLSEARQLVCSSCRQLLSAGRGARELRHVLCASRRARHVCPISSFPVSVLPSSPTFPPTSYTIPPPWKWTNTTITHLGLHDSTHFIRYRRSNVTRLSILLTMCAFMIPWCTQHKFLGIYI